MTGPSSMHETGHSKPVHWDNPEGWDGEGGGLGVQDAGHMYTHGWFMSMYGKTHQNNHDGVITHLEPDILECEVKWALERITTKKASGGDGIPVELF